MKKFLVKLFCLVMSVMLAVVCFSGCGSKEQREIKNVIIIIGDGMGLKHIEAGERYEEKNYSFTDWHQTTVNTDSVDGYGNLVLTDSAAGGTAISTGTLTINGYVGKDANGKDLQTVMDVAKGLGKATAVITTDTIYGATPGSFSGHSLSRNYTDEIVKSQIESSNVDLLCGATDAATTSAGVQMLAFQNGYTYCDNYENIADTLQSEKAYWQFDMAGVDASVYLEDVTAYALSFLEKDEDGFCVMLEQAYIDKYSHNNAFMKTVQSVVSLNKTVEVIMNWIGDRTDTAVFITADHETGGLFVGEEGEYMYTSKTVNDNTFSWQYSSTNHTQTPIGLFTYGIEPDFENFENFNSKDIIKNIETNKIIRTILADPKAY